MLRIGLREPSKLEPSSVQQTAHIDLSRLTFIIPY